MSSNGVSFPLGEAWKNPSAPLQLDFLSFNPKQNEISRPSVVSPYGSQAPQKKTEILWLKIYNSS